MKIKTNYKKSELLDAQIDQARIYGIFALLLIVTIFTYLAQKYVTELDNGWSILGKIIVFLITAIIGGLITALPVLLFLPFETKYKLMILDQHEKKKEEKKETRVM